MVLEIDILSDEFARAVENAGALARKAALAAGQSVVYVDTAGRCVEQQPDGRLFEIWLDPKQPRDSHRVRLRELTSHAA